MDKILQGNTLYRILAIAVLAAFYGTYVIKMLVQRRRGIRTNQIGRRKEAKAHAVEMLMSAATSGVVMVQLLSIALEWSHMPPAVRVTGFAAAAVGDGLFLAAVLCMKDSWRAGIPERDRTELVTGGIYSFSRNPAFLGFDLMYVGVMLLYCNFATVLFTLLAILSLHLQILQEEAYLEQTFGAEYRSYRQNVSRYLGRSVYKQRIS